MALLNTRDIDKEFHELVEGHIKEREKVSALDVQIGGNHYKDMKIQPIEYILANNLSFLQGNVIKYITRYKEKNKSADIRKAIHYCQLILESEYPNEEV